VSSGIDVVNIARQEIGYIEGPNNENKYGQWYGMDHESYCAMFVSWCFEQAGLSSIVAAQTEKGFAYCPTGLLWFQKKKQIVGKYSAQPGDIVFFNWTNTAQPDHVGIVVGASSDGLTTIEGNTSPDHATSGSQADGNGVYLRHRPYLNVMAIVRPAYPGAVKPSSSLSQNKGLAAGVAGATALGGGGAAIIHNNTPASTGKPPTVVVAPPFPGTTGFKVGTKSKAVLIVEEALVKAGLMPAALAKGTMTAEDVALVPLYQAKYPGLKGKKTLDSDTYASMVAKATS